MAGGGGGSGGVTNSESHVVDSGNRVGVSDGPKLSASSATGIPVVENADGFDRLAFTPGDTRVKDLLNFEYDGVLSYATFGSEDLSSALISGTGALGWDDGTNTRGDLTPCVYTGTGWMPLDGKLQIASGTVTVPSNDIARVLTGNGTGTELDVHWWIESDPNSNVGIDAEIYWWDSNGEQAVRFTNDGAAGVDVGYRIYELGADF